MIDEFCEGIIDRICEAVPRYMNPRMTVFCSKHFGWRMLLYTRSVKRKTTELFTGLQKTNERVMQEDQARLEEQAIDPKYAHLPKEEALELTRKDSEEKDREEEARKDAKREARKQLSVSEKIIGGVRAFAGSIVKLVFMVVFSVLGLPKWIGGRFKAIEAFLEKREMSAQARIKKNLQRVRPVMQVLQKSRFPFMLLLTMLSMLGVCAVGGKSMGYIAAACCTMWLASAFETGYAPVCGAVRQRYIAVLLLRGASALMLLPMYFLGYIGQGVRYNVLLQSSMTILLFAHAIFFLVLVAFNRRQKLMARVLAGVLGVIPALTASAAIAYAAVQIAMPMPISVLGVISAAGALCAFFADRIAIITELGGVRLYYTPIWLSGFMEIGYLLMLISTWLAA